VARSEGGNQVTYNGWPLHSFAGDSQPGDTNGQATGGVWFVVSPAGEAVRPAPAAAPAPAPTPAATPAPVPQTTTPAPAPAPSAAPQGGATSPAPQQSAPAVKTIAVEMANLSFKPVAISIKLGEAVRFAATNKDSVTHSFSFSVPGGGGYDVVVNGGQSKNGEPVTITKAGKIEFFCQFHAGMIGSLDVGASSASPAAPAGDTSGYNY
jgi:plastocyanin